MKKLLAIFTGLLMVFTLTACGNNDTPATDDPGTGGASKGGVHVFYYTYSDTYISTVRSALDADLNAAGIEFQNHDSNSNQTTQNEQIETAITNGAKILIVNIVDSGSIDAAQNITNLAKDAGIPVIFFNREIDDTVVNSYDKTLFIGTDAAEAGHLQGKMIGDFLVENYDAVDLNKDGNISYVMFKGQEGNNEAIYRTQFGVEDADAVLTAAGKPALAFYDASNANKYLVDQKGEWSAAAANEYMNTVLSEYSEANNNMVELIICNNDGMAEGAIEALKTAGYNLGGDSKIIPVFGVDATDAAKELIAAGSMTGTIKQDAEAMAKAIAESAANGLDGKTLLDGLSYTVDPTAAKVRINYAVYTGE